MEFNNAEQIIFLIADACYKGVADAQKKYDHAKNYEELVELQVLRRLLVKNVPQIIEKHINKESGEDWSMWEWYKQKKKNPLEPYKRKPLWKRLLRIP